MSKKPDDLETVRTLVTALEPFTNEDRDRIIRWVREKLGMPPLGADRQAAQQGGDRTEPTEPSESMRAELPAKDIRSFIQNRDPKTDQQLAAVVAYYYDFVAPEEERRDSITAADLVDACRRAEQKRPPAPGQVLINAYKSGILDRADRGSYRINSVGENLVAMVLPRAEGTSAPRAKRKPKRSATRAKRSGGSKKKRAKRRRQ